MIKTMIAIFLALLLTACSSSEKEKTTTTTEKQEKTVDKATVIESSSTTTKSQKVEVKKTILTINTLDEKEIKVVETEGGLTFQGHENKVVFLVLFGYRCPPCLKEMPNLIALMKKNYPDLEIIAIEVQGLNSEQLEEFKERKGINYTLALGSENNRFISYVASKAQWHGAIPFFLSFNKKGEVKVVHVGALNYKQLESIYTDIHK